MTDYTIYFSLYGKKMKTTVTADSEEQAKNIVKDKIVFHKITRPPDQVLKDLMDIFGME